MTRCLVLLVAATLAGAAAALFWAFVKVGGDFRERAGANADWPDADRAALGTRSFAGSSPAGPGTPVEQRVRRLQR